MKISGIYCIINVRSGKKYIGRSKHIARRLREHFYNLNRGKHHSHYLQNSFNKNGENSFICGIIESCPNEETYLKEKYYIDKYQSFGFGYNECIPSGNREGRIFTDEDRKKHSIALRPARKQILAALARGRKNALKKCIRKVYLYNKEYNLIHTLNSHRECADFLNIKLKTFESAVNRIGSKGHWTYKGFIVIRQGDTIGEYIKRYDDYKAKSVHYTK